MCYGNYNLNLVQRQQKIKPKTRLISLNEIKNLIQKAQLLLKELELNRGNYLGIGLIIDVRQTIEELKNRENTKDLSIIQKLEREIEPHLIDINPENYW